MTHEVWRSRVVRAILIVASLFALVMLSGHLEGAADVKEPGSTHGMGIRSSNLAGESDPDALLARLGEIAETDSSELPRYFEDELGLIGGARDVRVSGGEDIVGYVVDRSLSETAESVSSLMRRKGWLEVPLGNNGGATFVKENGVCSWALVTFATAGDTTSVVYRCVVV